MLITPYTVHTLTGSPDPILASFQNYLRAISHKGAFETFQW